MQTPANNHTLSAASARLMNIEEAALRLGVSRAGIYRLAARGEINLIRLGRRVLVDPADLDAMIGRHKCSGVPEKPE